MPSKFLSLFFLLLLSRFAAAQEADLKEKVARIDALMDKYFTNYDQAIQEAELLHELITAKYDSKAYKGYKIDVMLQKSILYSLNGDHHKALQLSLEALDEAEAYKLPERIYHCCWVIAIMYENGNDLTTCRAYLDKAYQTYATHRLDHIYSVYCIRISSYFSRVQKQDSALHFAYKALDAAPKYQNKREIRDAYLLLGGFLAKKNYPEAVRYKSLAAQKFIEIEDFSTAAVQFTGAASILLRHNQIAEAFKYSDSAFAVLKGTDAYISPDVYEKRSQLFEKIGNTDSAYHYFQKYHEVYVSEQHKMETAKIKQISEQYQNDKKESVIQNREQQIILISCLLAVIIVGAVALFLKNRQINTQNKIINQQLEELIKSLNQKQVLLSELQHRVKNNLQHVISILEIQKESANFNNIDELIRGNQNRIHSMALLHKKLNVSDKVNEVDLNRYVSELAELVKDSYDNHHKKISLRLKCEVETISIEKALPIGLIITELVSNSMKHAFKRVGIGIIQIEITQDAQIGRRKLYYADNGTGFDFNKARDKGLGLEVIKGLIDQLDGSSESSGKNGFELTVYFN